MRKALTASIGIGALVGLMFTQAQATAASRPVYTTQQIASMAPQAQAALLQPLRDAADALAQVGTGSGASSYGGVALDPNHGFVDLYLTDPPQAASFVASARRFDAALTTDLVHVHQAAYTKQALQAARVQFLAQPHPFAVYAIGPNADGSGLYVEVANPATAAATQGRMLSPATTIGPAAAAPAIALQFAKGTARSSKVGTFPAKKPFGVHPNSAAWAAVKWHDSSPFIGGDVVTSNGYSYCTTGLPAVRKSDGHPIMVTAAHCFPTGTATYTGAGPTWSWGNGLTGNYIGTVTSRNQNWDAETLDGANNNADESDNEGWKPLTSVRYSNKYDFVCQSGARSAYMGHGTPCGIQVTNPDLWFPVDGYNARGVEGVDVNGWGSVSGDSGGIVFGILSGNNREARGIVSAGGADGTPDQARVDWTEAIDIFNAYGLKLNPVT